MRSAPIQWTTMSFWRGLARVVGRRAMLWGLVGLVASIGLAAVELALSWFIQAFLRVMGLMSPLVVVSVGPDIARFSPYVLGIALVVVAGLRGMAQWTFWQSSFVMQEIVVARLRRLAVYDVLLAKPRRYTSASELQSAIGEGFIKSSTAIFALVLLIGSSAQAVVLWYFMVRAAWKPTLYTTAGLVLVAGAVTIMNGRVRRYADRVPEAVDGLNAGLFRVLRNALLVRVLRTEQREYKHLTSHIDSHLGYSVNASWLGNFAQTLPPFVGVILVLTVLAFVGGDTSPSALLTFLYLFTRFVQTAAIVAQQAGQVAQHAGHGRRALGFVSAFRADEIDEAMSDVPAVAAVSASPRGEHRPPTFAVERMSYAYDTSERNVLSDLSLTIPAGNCFAVVGPSGVGKSTLLGLLLGVFEPCEGTLTVNGLRASEYFEQYGPRTGYVGAEAFLVAGTLRDNLCYGADMTQVTDAQLWEALRAARLDEQVRLLPGGLQYAVNEDGGGLSAGQKQRLCLARALLVDPELLVLDEASANLDEVTEGEIAESLRVLRGRCTIVIVSHRPGILKYADIRLDLSGASAPRPVVSTSTEVMA